MISAAELLAMSDNELAIHLNGGYGAEKRNQAMAGIRNALRYTEQHAKAAVDEIMERHRPVQIT